MSEFIIRAEKKISLNLNEFWQFRELFYFFTWRDIKVKYKQTFIGFLWAILQPLLMMVVFTVFFGKVINKDIESHVPYPVFVFAGLILWNVFSSGLSGAGNSMIVNANIIKKIYFPRLIIPISAILVSAFDFIMTLIVFAFLLIYYQINVGFISIVFIPLALFMTMVGTFGAGSLIAALSVKYRDFRYITPFLIQFLLFVTPVIYPISFVENNLFQFLLSLNPLTGPINLLRSGIFGTPMDWQIFALSSLSSIILILLGLFTFKKTESYFADIA